MGNAKLLVICITVLFIRNSDAESENINLSNKTISELLKPVKTLISAPNVCTNGTEFLIVMHSTVVNFGRRDAVRRTFGKERWRKELSFNLLFVMGGSGGSAMFNEWMRDESDRYGDILQGDFVDSYYNLTMKSVFWLRFVSTHCRNISHIIHLDDDIVIDLFSLKRLLVPARADGTSWKSIDERRAAQSTVAPAPSTNSIDIPPINEDGVTPTVEKLINITNPEVDQMSNASSMQNGTEYNVTNTNSTMTDNLAINLLPNPPNTITSVTVASATVASDSTLAENTTLSPTTVETTTEPAVASTISVNDAPGPIHLDKYTVYCLAMMYHETPVIRNPKSKWYVPVEGFSDDMYPDYCAGAAYLLPMTVIPELVAMVDKLNYISADDALVTGIARESCWFNIQAVSPEAVFRHDVDFVYHHFEYGLTTIAECRTEMCTEKVWTLLEQRHANNVTSADLLINLGKTPVTPPPPPPEDTVVLPDLLPVNYSINYVQSYEEIQRLRSFKVDMPFERVFREKLWAFFYLFLLALFIASVKMCCNAYSRKKEGYVQVEI